MDLLLPTQADKSNTVIDTLRAIIVSDVQGHSAFPAVDQEANDGMMRFYQTGTMIW